MTMREQRLVAHRKLDCSSQYIDSVLTVYRPTPHSISLILFQHKQIFANMNVSISQIPASPESIVRDFHCFQLAIFRKHFRHFCERNEAFGIVRNDDELRVQIRNYFFHRFQSKTRLVEHGTIPILRNSAHFADCRIKLVF